MLELLWLLLPVAAFSGWLLALRDCRGRGKATRLDIAPEYFKGLTYLLNEQPDKAIEVFIRMVDVDSETVETHLALGSLFRRRGEVDRAIRIHQNLIARPTLNREQRTYALLELGFDYMRAGLLDRAESLLLELIELREHVVPALRQLVDIYQQEKDWDKAVAALVRLEAATGKPQHVVIAHCYCELAEAARRAGDAQLAAEKLEQALTYDRRCVRASLIEGEMAAEVGDPRGAVRAYQRVEQQDPAYLTEAIDPMVAAHRQLDDPAALILYLSQLWREHRSTEAMLAWVALVREQQGEAAAIAVLTAQLALRPSTRGLAELMELRRASDPDGMRDDFLVLSQLVQQLMACKLSYKCAKCGFSGQALYWQCPSCRSWNTIRPVPA